MGQESDDIMLGGFFDFLDARGIEGGMTRLFPDRFCRLLRYAPNLGQGIAGISLDFEPNPEPRLCLPNGRHLRACVARDHGRNSALGVLGRQAKSETMEKVMSPKRFPRR